MKQKPRSVIVFFVAGVLLCAVALTIYLTRYLDDERRVSISGGNHFHPQEVESDPYPPPGATESASPSIPTIRTTVQMSPHAVMLSQLEHYISARDTAGLANLFADRIDSPVNIRQGALPGSLTSDTAGQVFDDLFANGSTPILRGYYDYDGVFGVGCLALYTSGWTGPAGVPTPAWAGHVSVPTLEPEEIMDPGEALSAIRDGSLDFMWDVCIDSEYTNTKIEIHNWVIGEFQNMIEDEYLYLDEARKANGLDTDTIHFIALET